MKSGFVSVVGRANVGKSTLMEKILREKISIISNKPQTTRDKINIIYNDDDSQIIFIDTPGIQKPRNILQERLLSFSKESLNESDLVTFVVDDSKEIGSLDRMIIDELKNVRVPIILLINKTDLLTEDELFDLEDLYDEEGIFDAILGISALDDKNIDKYISLVKTYLKEGPAYYDLSLIHI